MILGYLVDSLVDTEECEPLKEEEENDDDDEDEDEEECCDEEQSKFTKLARVRVSGEVSVAKRRFRV